MGQILGAGMSEMEVVDAALNVLELLQRRIELAHLVGFCR